MAAAGRTTTAPVIDGQLSDTVWTSVTALTGFRQREPVEGEPVSERTEVRFLHDDAALYIGAWLYDRRPEGPIVRITWVFPKHNGPYPTLGQITWGGFRPPQCLGGV